LKSGQKILAEGAQGSLLDIDFGTYPFVTSSNTVTAGACTGLGIAPGKIGNVIGIFKAYCTRVGSGPFPTELLDETGEMMRQIGREFGSTTGRPRRCGWLDLPALNFAITINGVTELNMMKADVLGDFETIKICTKYLVDGVESEHLPYDINFAKIEPIYVELPGWKKDLTSLRSQDELPDELLNYISFIEEHTGVPVTTVSIGPDRTQTIQLSKQQV
jgi:adenylosuccinate synthase